MAQKLNAAAAFQDKYLAHYQAVHDVLRERLPNLAEGKQGFVLPV